MGRWTSFLGSSKGLAASSVTTFTGNDLPSAGVVAFHFAMKPSGNIVSDIDRIRVKADNRLLYDVRLSHFQKWQERFSTVGYALPGSLQRFTIPFNLFDIVDDDLADTCQFPRGTVPTVEITTNAGAVAGDIYVGWTQTDAQPVFYPTLLGQSMNIAPGVKNATFPINERGAIRGAILDTVGVDRFKMELNGFTYHQLAGNQYGGAVAFGDMLLESQSLEDGAGTSGRVTIDAQVGLRVPMIVASQGASRVEMDTVTGGATPWVGVTNEITLWAVHNQN